MISCLISSTSLRPARTSSAPAVTDKTGYFPIELRKYPEATNCCMRPLISLSPTSDKYPNTDNASRPARVMRSVRSPRTMDEIIEAPYRSSVAIMARNMAFASFVTLTRSPFVLQELQLLHSSHGTISPK